jgi:oligosaccharide repeat unit polymerase
MRLGRAIILAFGICALPILIYLLPPGSHWLLSSREEPLVLLALAFVLLLAFPFAYGFLKNGKVDVFEPSAIVSVCFLFGYVLPIPEFLDGQDELSKFIGLRISDFYGSLRLALLAVILGVLCFYVGYYVLPRKPKPRPPVGDQGAEDVLAWNGRRLLGIGVSYSVVGLVLFALGIYFLGGPSRLFAGIGDRIVAFAGLNYFVQAIQALLVVSLIWWSHLLITRRIRKLWFWAYAVWGVVLSSLTGNKSTIVVVVLAATLLYHLLYRKINARRAVVGGATVLALVTAIGLFTREYLAVRYFPTYNPHDVVGSAQGWLSSALGGNFMQIQTLTVLADRVPTQLPYQWGRTYLAFFTAPVPRALSPHKLLPAPGIFTLAVWPHLWLEEGTTIPPGLVGEMYMNFGFPGIAVGMAMFGYLLARLQAACGPRYRTVWVLFYALMVGMIPHFIRGDLEDGAVALAILSLPTLVAAWFARIRRVRIAPANARSGPLARGVLIT